MITTTALERFRKEPRILAAYMLGSAVHGALRPDSDVDFGLLLQPGETLSALEINDLTSELTLDIGRPVDERGASAKTPNEHLSRQRPCAST